MNLKFIGTFICISLIINAYSQFDSTSFFKDLKEYYIAPRDPRILFKVKTITIKDNRPDTARIGFYERDFTFSKKDAQIFLKDSSLQRLYSKYLTADSSNTHLILVINHLFISNRLPTNEEIRERNRFSNTNAFVNQITYQAKIYIQQNEYYQGLIKIDTFFESKKTANNFYELLLDETLNYTSYLIGNTIQQQYYINHPKLSIVKVDSLNIPVYAQSSPVSEENGYYKSYKDFIQQKLTSADFEMHNLDKGAYYAFVINGKDSQLLSRSVWGISYHNSLYIMDNGLLFPLIKSGNSYYYKGVFKYNETGIPIPFYIPAGTVAVGGFERANTKINLDYVPYLLNLQTGKKY